MRFGRDDPSFAETSYSTYLIPGLSPTSIHQLLDSLALLFPDTRMAGSLRKRG